MNLAEKVRLYQQYNRGELSQKAIAARYGVTTRTIRYWNQEAKQVLKHVEPQQDHDYDVLNGIIAHALKTKDRIVIGIKNDEHIGNTDSRAVEVSNQVFFDANLDFITDGSDMFDFGNISRFGSTIYEQAEDALHLALDEYRERRDTLRQVAPSAVSFFHCGNHDVRIKDHSTQKAPQYTQTLQSFFVDAVKQSGSLWLGWNSRSQGVSFGDYLYIIHGFTASKHTADNMLMKMPTTHQWIVAGHNHRHTVRHRTGFNGKGSVQWSAMTTGCLCDKSPHYLKDKPISDWQHGFAIATIDTRLKRCFVEHVDIFPGYVARYNGKMYRSAKVYKLGQIRRVA